MSRGVSQDIEKNSWDKIDKAMLFAINNSFASSYQSNESCQAIK